MRQVNVNDETNIAESKTVQPNYHRVPLPELARTMLMIGLLGFGGPIAHLALMESELVTQRRWLTREYFLDLLAAINLVPGPNSTEMALQIGLLTGGIRGMLLAGAGFILPAAILSIALAMFYNAAGSIPSVRGLLAGIQPVVLVIILSAAYRLGQKVLDNIAMRVLVVVAVFLVLVGSVPLMTWIGINTLYIPELVLLLGTGAAYLIWKRRHQIVGKVSTLVVIPLPLLPLISTANVAPQSASSPTLIDLFWRFLVIGGTLFGSGHVIAAYLQRTFVESLGWLTPAQLLDVLAIGQATPGPLLSTSSAAGYVMTAATGNVWAGIPGAIVATIGVFLPAFVVVMILGKVVPLIRRYPVVLEFLKGVNVGVIALLAGAFVNLAYATLVRPTGIDWLSIVIIVVAFVLLERYKLNALLLIGLGAAIGVARVLLGIG